MMKIRSSLKSSSDDEDDAIIEEPLNEGLLEGQVVGHVWSVINEAIKVVSCSERNRPFFIHERRPYF